MIDLPIMRNHQSPPPSPPPDSIFKRDALASARAARGMSRVCSTQPRPATRFPVFKGLPTPRSHFRRRWRPPRKEPRRDHGDERLILNEEGTTGLSNDGGLLAQLQIVRERTVSLLGQKLQGRGLSGRAMRKEAGCRALLLGPDAPHAGVFGVQEVDRRHDTVGRDAKGNQSLSKPG